MTVMLGGYALYNRSFQISNNRSAANNEPAQSTRPVPLQDTGLFVFFRDTVFDQFVLFASILYHIIKVDIKTIELYYAG